MDRLTLEITDHQHQTLMDLAAAEGKSVQQYALERLFPGDGVSADQAWQDLQALLRERITAGLAGKVSTKTVATIVDEGLAGYPHA